MCDKAIGEGKERTNPEQQNQPSNKQSSQAVSTAQESCRSGTSFPSLLQLKISPKRMISRRKDGLMFVPSLPGHISAPVTCVSLGLCFSFLSVSHTQFLCGSTVPTACLHPQRGEEPRKSSKSGEADRRAQVPRGLSLLGAAWGSDSRAPALGALLPRGAPAAGTSPCTAIYRCGNSRSA